MAEGRMLKKAISTSRRLADLQTDSARMLYTWIIPHLDVEGRFYADPLMIKGAIVPRIKTFTEAKISECIKDMAMVGLIVLYRVDGDNYLQLRKFEDHQNIKKEREAPSKIPAPEEGMVENSGVDQENSGVDQEQIRSCTAQDKIREVKIREEKERTTLDQVKAYCKERKNHVDAEKWFDHYTSNGWMVGKNKMKDWKAAVRTWEKSSFDPPGKVITPQKEYEPDPVPLVTEEERKRNLEKIRGFTASIGRASP